MNDVRSILMILRLRFKRYTKNATDVFNITCESVSYLRFVLFKSLSELHCSCNIYIG